MPWWEFEPDKKYPFVAADPMPDSGRVGFAVALMVGGFLLFAVSVIGGLFFRAWGSALWGMALAAGLACLGRLVMPKGSTPKLRP